MSETVKTFCGRLCGGTCGTIVTIDGGRVTSVRGDPESPFSRGAICAKGRAAPAIMYHPDRLSHPLKRVGARGEGKWQQITMDEALGLVAERLRGLSASYGPESIMVGQGSSKGGLDLYFPQRFGSAIGTPNIVTIANVCHVPREQAAAITFGSTCVPDYQAPPKCLVVWGSNTQHTNTNGGTGAQFRPAFEKGTKFIVIDPRRIPMTSRADMWLKLRPGSDGLLALGMLNVIVNEGLYDHEFVEKWTVGFDQLRLFLDSYPVRKVADLTWVPAADIERAARVYATTKPAAVQWGNAIDQTSNALQTCRAIAVLRAVTGNLDVPGGDLLPGGVPGLMKPGDYTLVGLRRGKKSVGEQFKLAAEMNFVPSQVAVDAILTERPYPLRAAVLFGTDPLMSYSEVARSESALRKLEFLAVADMFLSPAASLADVVLPVALNLEFDDIGQYPGRSGFITARPKLVEPPGECLSDVMMMNRIGQKMGFGQHFWNSDREGCDAVLKPAGLTYEDLKSRGVIFAPVAYRKYERNGFRTSSGKVELYSGRLEQLGYAPLPGFAEPAETPFGSLDLAREYPLVLTCNKNPYYYHSNYRAVPSLRRLSPEPVAEMNPTTASRFGLKAGDWVYVETPRGRVRQKLAYDVDLDPRVVVGAYGWWFPERLASAPESWRESNLNVLTAAAVTDPAFGTPNLRGGVCRVSKA